MRVLFTTSRYLAKAGFYLACLALIFMAGHMFLDVVLRRLGIYIEGTLEFTSYYYMIFAVFSGLAYTQYKDKHISTDILVNLLPKKVSDSLLKFNLTIQLVLYALLTYQTTIDAFNSASFNEQAMANFTFYIWPAKFSLPIGFFSLCLVVLSQLLASKSERDAWTYS